MNLNTAIETMRYARDLDSRLEVTKALQKTIDSLANLASNPADGNNQQSVRAALDNLANRLSDVHAELSEADATRLQELGAGQLFPVDLYEGVVEHFNANMGTPAVSQNNVQQILNARNEILQGFQTVIDVAQAREWEADGEVDGAAEVGFTVPRAIFDNKLKGLTKELDWINRLMSSVTEASTGQHEDFQVSRLSTSDPTVFIVSSYAVALTFGKLVTWALATWKSVEEIRHLRTETSKLAAFKPEEVETIFGDKIKQQVSEQIQAQATELTSKVADTGRKNELHSGLSMLLEQFLQRVERGMTVEIRLIGQHDVVVESEAGDDGSTRYDLETLAAELTFPPASAAPVLKLSGGASDVERRTAARSTRASPSPKKAGSKASESRSKSD